MITADLVRSITAHAIRKTKEELRREVIEQIEEMILKAAHNREYSISYQKLLHSVEIDHLKERGFSVYEIIGGIYSITWYTK